MLKISVKMSVPKKKKVDAECRIFNNNWTLSYLFTDLNGKPLCLVCGITIAVMKEFNLRRHYDSHHKEKFEKFEGQARNEEVKKLMLQLKKQQCCFVKPQQISDGAVKASYVIANEIAIASKPFTEGEFVKKCILLAAENICPEKRSDLNSISLSRNTVAERISELATDLDNQLKEKVKQFVAVSVAIDESTDITDVAQLAIFIRGVNASLDITEEFLQLVPLLNTTTSDDIFCAVQDALDKIGLDWSRVVSLATDGAPAMIGKKSGAATKIKKKSRIDESRPCLDFPLHFTPRSTMCQNLKNESCCGRGYTHSKFYSSERFKSQAIRKLTARI